MFKFENTGKRGGERYWYFCLLFGIRSPVSISFRVQGKCLEVLTHYHTMLHFDALQICHAALEVLRVLYLKDGHLDFSHLTELENLHITEIFMKKQYKSSIIKNHKIKKKKKKMVFL